MDKLDNYYFDFSGTGSIKGKNQTESEKKVNTYNVIGLKVIVVDSKGKISMKKIDLHDIVVTYENPATV
jgi:hypothetical protein